MRAASTLEFAALLLQARENSRTGLPIATTFNPLVFAERSALSMLTRTRPNSFALSGAFTRSVQSTGRSTGQGDKMALIASSPCILAHRPLQRQCSARATNPAPHSVPLDVPQDGQQMFVALHREALEPSPIQMTVPDGPVRDPPTHRMRVCQPTEEGRHLAVCIRPDGEVPVVGQDAVGQDADRVPLVRW